MHPVVSSETSDVRGVMMNNFFVGLSLVGAAAAEEFHAPGTAPSHAPGTAPSPGHEAPAHRNHLVDLAPVPTKSHVTGFSNPFRQYEGGSIPDWQYGGDATLFNDYLSLTPASPNRIGHVWSTKPLELPSWEVEFEFHVGGAQQRGTGGGLAFWWSAEPAGPGTIYGHSDDFNGVGIFFDTYEPEARTNPESQHDPEPYIVAMVNDGTKLGAQVLGDSEKLASQQVAVCFARYRNLAHIARARIAWANGMLRLWLDLERSNVYQPCLETAVGDARMGTMPTSGYFGLSASTGPYGDAHVLYSMTASRLDPLLDDVQLATPHETKPGEAPLEQGHEVHTEAADHTTHVKVVPNEAPVEHHAEKGAEPQHPTPVHVPPSQSESEQLTHALLALETAHEIRDSISAVMEEVSAVETVCASKTHEVYSLVSTVHQEVLNLKSVVHAPGGAPLPAGSHAPATPDAPHASATPHAPAGAHAAAGVDALSAKLDAHAHSIAEHGRILSAVREKVEASGVEAHRVSVDALAAGKTLLGKVETIESVLESRMSTLHAQVKNIKDQVDHERMVSQATQSELKAEAQSVKQILEELKRLNAASAGSGAGGYIFPLAVCAQALVVTAVLFYAVASGGKRSRSHLP